VNDADLAALVLVIADSIERQDQAESAGVLRQAARRIVTGEGSAEGCERCGSPIERKATGRPRRYCSERCRRKRAGNASLVA
jgi:predicted metalloprotease